jgi:hypothetical protein
MRGSNGPSHTEQSVFEFCFVTCYCAIKRVQQNASMLIYSWNEVPLRREFRQLPSRSGSLLTFLSTEVTKVFWIRSESVLETHTANEVTIIQIVITCTSTTTNDVVLGENMKILKLVHQTWKTKLDKITGPTDTKIMKVVTRFTRPLLSCTSSIQLRFLRFYVQYNRKLWSTWSS